MCRPQPLHQHPSLGNRAHRDARKPTLLCCTNVAAWVDCGPRVLQEGWLRGEAPAGSWQRPSERRTSNVLPSTITSAP